MIDLNQFKIDCANVRKQSPLTHCITNYVAMEINANALLAIGASPLMSFAPEEMDEIVRISNALVINIGCLDRHEIEGMKAAAEAAVKYGKPWVLDPVGACASRLRTETALELIKEWHPTVIRGNASEIMVLAGSSIVSKGVDSNNSSSDALDGAKALAAITGSVVSISGATDYITDGYRVETICNGHPIMSKVTAMGCTASAITGAFAAVSRSPFEAALHAMAVMGVAGDIAAAKCKGTGSMGVEFIDALSNFDAEANAKLIRQ